MPDNRRGGYLAQRVHWLLIELGVSFEAVSVDFGAGDQKTADFLRLNPAGRVPTRRGVVLVLTLLLAVVGPLVCAGLISAGHRAAAADRVRSLGPPRRWRVPGRWRAPLARALGDADLALEPEQAVEYWAIAIVGATVSWE